MEQTMESQSQQKTTSKSDQELVKEQKIKLNKEIKEVCVKLKGICNDAKFADELIDKLLSLKGQYDIEPTLVHVPIESVIKEYDFGHFKFIRTHKYIIFHIAGMDMVIPPMMQTLYGHIDWLLNQKDNLSSLNEQDKELYDTVFEATMTVLLNPTICFMKDDYWFDIATYVASKQNSLFESLLNEDLKPEGPVADEEFNINVEFAEQLKKEAKEYAKMKGGTDELQ